MMEFRRVQEGCCLRSNVLPSRGKVASTCACEAHCRTHPNCTFFSYRGYPSGECTFCSSLSDCSQHGFKSRLTWQRMTSSEVAGSSFTFDEAAHARMVAPACPKGRFIVQASRRRIQVRMGADPRHALSHFLGVARRGVTDNAEAAAVAPQCSEIGEEGTFRSACAERVAEMDAHLTATIGRR